MSIDAYRKLKQELCKNPAKLITKPFWTYPDDLLRAVLTQSEDVSVGLILETKSPDLVRVFLGSNPYAIKRIPQELLTQEACQAMVEKDGNAISKVPYAFRNPELIMTALERSGYNIAHVPQEKMTDEYLEAAIEFSFQCLGRVPTDCITMKIAAFAMASTANCYQYLPDELKTPDYSVKAVNESGVLIEFVPQYLLTSDLCLTAVKKSAKAIEKIPGSFITDEMIWISCIAEPRYLHDVSSEKFKSLHDQFASAYKNDSLARNHEDAIFRLVHATHGTKEYLLAMHYLRAMVEPAFIKGKAALVEKTVDRLVETYGAETVAGTFILSNLAKRKLVSGSLDM